MYLAAACGDSKKLELLSSLVVMPLLGRAKRRLGAVLGSAATLGRLLLVEDNEINQMVTVGILTELGYDVDVVPTA